MQEPFKSKLVVLHKPGITHLHCLTLFCGETHKQPIIAHFNPKNKCSFTNTDQSLEFRYLILSRNYCPKTQNIPVT